jgi:hypothetical protein
MATVISEKLTDNLSDRLEATDISPLIGSRVGLDKQALLSGRNASDLRRYARALRMSVRRSPDAALHAFA